MQPKQATGLKRSTSRLRTHQDLVKVGQAGLVLDLGNDLHVGSARLIQDAPDEQHILLRLDEGCRHKVHLVLAAELQERSQAARAVCRWLSLQAASLAEAQPTTGPSRSEHQPDEMHIVHSCWLPTPCMTNTQQPCTG